MKSFKSTLYFIVFVASLGLSSSLITACSSSSQPEALPVAIEDTEGGGDLIEREFGECDGELNDDNVPMYVRAPVMESSASGRAYVDMLRNPLYSDAVSSEGKLFPLRGSWRKSKADIMDLVDRWVWTPDRGPVRLLRYFDMILKINVAPRDGKTPEDSSAQTMQIVVRTGHSDELSDWRVVQTWDISSGSPCITKGGVEKIATPTGVFKFNPASHRFTPQHYSSQYDNIDMFETMFLYHVYQNGKTTGVAVHGTYKTSSLGMRDSGGCIRLYRDNSKCLYDTFRGNLSETCVPGSKLGGYYNTTASFHSKNGEADPDYVSNGTMEWDGYRVLVAIFEDVNAKLEPVQGEL